MGFSKICFSLCSWWYGARESLFAGYVYIQRFKMSRNNNLKHGLRLTQQKHHPVFEKETRRAEGR